MGKTWFLKFMRLKFPSLMVAGNTFAVTMRIDSTMKDKKRSDMTELCVYHVKDGKIVSEQFFM